MEKKVLIWDEGEKKGQVMLETSYLPDNPILKVPLPKTFIAVAIRMIGDEEAEMPPPEPIKYAECKRTEMVVEGKRLYLCKEVKLSSW